MKKSGVAIFVVLAVIVAATIAIAMRDEGAPSSSDRLNSEDEAARDLFVTNCGSCHTLAAAGTDGVVGPNLDSLLGAGTAEGNEPRVLTAIEDGINGRMPAGILAGQQAEEVAQFVAENAGQ